MDVLEIRRGNVTVFRVRGDLDLHSAGSFREQVDLTLNQLPVPRVVFDLSEVGVIDSSGLGALIGRYRRVKELGGEMVLVGATPTARKVVEMGGLTRLVPLLASEKAAVSRLGGGENIGGK